MGKHSVQLFQQQKTLQELEAKEACHIHQTGRSNQLGLVSIFFRPLMFFFSFPRIYAPLGMQNQLKQKNAGS